MTDSESELNGYHIRGCLDRDSIRKLMLETPPLLEGVVDLETQLQPNGIDLTLSGISNFSSAGKLAVNNADRVISAVQPMPWDSDGILHLTPGSYLIDVKEKVNLPLYLMAISKPRSSLLRSGVAIHNAIWDAGYAGRAQALMVVYNEHGFSISRYARVMQLVLYTLTSETKHGYKGIYSDS